ncbi:hypothetical protein ACLMJK_005333 [Lecanora helva]
MPISDIHEQSKENTKFNAPPNDHTDQAEASSSGRKQSKIEPDEAIQRGLSFGPLKKVGSQPSSTPGILKATSNLPSSRSIERSPSLEKDDLAPRVVGHLKRDEHAEDYKIELGVESGDENQVESSDEETSALGDVRSKKHESEPEQRRLPRNPLVQHKEDPPVAVPESPEGTRQLSAKKFEIHPKPRPEQVVCRPASPNTSDSEEIDAIHRAQKLSIAMSTIDTSVPHRSIQSIVRGDFALMQEEAREGSRRLRSYIVAISLRDEGSSALEWTIGSILRDGDTLLAIHAIDEASSSSVSLSEAERERSQAIKIILETCLKSLRKTKLQVRIAIQVNHTKSAKELVVEAVNGFGPTMTITGFHGRSSLKGDLFGSFSSYILSKTSVPVMKAPQNSSARDGETVAPKMYLVNNLDPSRRLSEAKKKTRKIKKEKIDGL